MAGAALLLAPPASPAAAATEVQPPVAVERRQRHDPSQQHQQQQRLGLLPVAAAAPPVVFAAANDLGSLAAVGGGGGGAARPHWLATVLGVGAVNVAGLWGVLKLLQLSKDASTPATLLTLRLGLRVDGTGAFRARLRDIRGTVLAAERGTFFALEEAVQAACSPPRGVQLSYAELSAEPLASKLDGYGRFKRRAAAAARAAALEEGATVVRGAAAAVTPPRHRSRLERLLGAESTAEDLDEQQPMVLLTLVALAEGTIQLPSAPPCDAGAVRATLTQLCGRLRSQQMLALEMLLTPEGERDLLSEATLRRDWPGLVDLTSGRRVADEVAAVEAAEAAEAAAAARSSGSSNGRGSGSGGGGDSTTAAAGAS